MTQRIGYEYEGEVVTNLKDLAPLLGADKVTRKDIKEGGQFFGMVNIVDLDLEDEANTEDDNWDKEPSRVEPEEDKHPMEVNKDEVYSAMEEGEEVDLTPEQVKESMPEFEDLDELKEFIKDIDTPTLEYLAKGLGLEWTPTYHKNIHRMRIAMTMHRYFFPDMFKPKDTKKKKAKYGDYSTEQLVKMAEEHNIEYKETENEAINRMNLIMELKKAGHLGE